MKNPVWAYIFRSKSDDVPLIEMLAKLPIFENLGRGQLKQVTRSLHERDYTKGETIFNESEPGAGLYIIEAGRVEITKDVEGSTPVVLAQFVAGNFFGELALIDEIPRSATAIAADETKLLAFPKPDLDRLIDRQPQLAVKILYNLARLITQRLVAANSNLEQRQKED